MFGISDVGLLMSGGTKPLHAIPNIHRVDFFQKQRKEFIVRTRDNGSGYDLAPALDTKYAKAKQKGNFRVFFDLLEPEYGKFYILPAASTSGANNLFIEFSKTEIGIWFSGSYSPLLKFPTIPRFCIEIANQDFLTVTDENGNILGTYSSSNFYYLERLGNFSYVKALINAIMLVSPSDIPVSDDWKLFKTLLEA